MGKKCEKKQKIGIMTSYGSANYGSNLQAIGLGRALEKKGYDVYFVKKFEVYSFFLKHPIMLYARILNRIHRKRSISFFIPVRYDITDERKSRITDFNKKYFKEICFENKKSWQAAIRDKMIFVAGSDIIWNPARGYPAKYFLDFAYFAGLKRFSYASSIGELHLPEKYNSAYKRYIGTMSAVGVREQSVVDLLQPIVAKKIEKVVDPSLLLSSAEWDQYAEEAEISVEVNPKGFVLCYFVMEDSRYWEYVKKIKEKTDLQIIVLPMHYLDEKMPYDIIYDGTAKEFLWLIKHADFICTDSFHACAFSLQYQKEFYLLRRRRKSEDAKYDDFLTRYRLLNRRVEDESEFIRIPKIDYSEANKQLEQERKFANIFLDKALED